MEKAIRKIEIMITVSQYNALYECADAFEFGGNISAFVRAVLVTEGYMPAVPIKRGAKKKEGQA